VYSGGVICCRRAAAVALGLAHGRGRFLVWVFFFDRGDRRKRTTATAGRRGGGGGGSKEERRRRRVLDRQLGQGRACSDTMLVVVWRNVPWSWVRLRVI
jgi:hypothetical protein